MTDLHNISNEAEEENELIYPEDKDIFIKQSKELENLQAKLQELRDENKKQMEAILKGLDELAITKDIVSETLDQNESAEALPVLDKNKKVSDLLAEIVGFHENGKTAIDSLCDSIDSLKNEFFEDYEEESSDVNFEKDMNLKDVQKLENSLSNDDTSKTHPRLNGDNLKAEHLTTEVDEKISKE